MEVFRGEEPFVQSAVTAAYAYVFYPAIRRNGVEINAWVELTVPFAVPEGRGQGVIEAPADKDLFADERSVYSTGGSPVNSVEVDADDAAAQDSVRVDAADAATQDPAPADAAGAISEQEGEEGI